jgi:acyl transferase domain-containing protein
MGQIPQCLTPWPMDGLRRVSVNCFGFGGTNAHLILDDAFNYMSERGIIGNHTSANLSLPTSPSTTDSWVYLRNPSEKCVSHWTSKTPMQLYVLSAHEESGVLRLSSQYAEYLTKRNISNMPGQDAVQTGSNLAYTLGIRRTKLPWKAFLVSSSPENLSSAFLEQLSTPNRASQAPNISFVFNGQGAQWYAMGRELLEYHIFEDCLNMAETYLRSLGCEWSLMSELLKDAEVSLIDLPRISQPLCTALQIALVDLLGHWGVEPQAVVGHSSGEIAAAYALGALTREDAWKLSYHRGRLTSAMKFLAPNLRGRMMAVALSTDEMQKYLANLKEGIAIIACINSPESVTISGDEFAVLELQNLLKHDGIFARLLKVDNAYHSHHMKIIEHHYLQSIKGLQPLAAKLGRKMVSSVTGEVINSSDLGPYYWAQNLVSPVKFLEALTSLLRSKGYKPDIILEIGPHAALQGPIKQILDATLKTKSKPISISILYRGKDAISTSLSTAGYLWTLGTPIDLNKVNTR